MSMERQPQGGLEHAAVMGAECDLIDHVKTQLPYACVNGGIAFAAFLLAGFTRSPLSVAPAVALPLAVMMVWGEKGEKASE